MQSPKELNNECCFRGQPLRGYTTRNTGISGAHPETITQHIDGTWFMLKSPVFPCGVSHLQRRNFVHMQITSAARQIFLPMANASFKVRNKDMQKLQE